MPMALSLIAAYGKGLGFESGVHWQALSPGPMQVTVQVHDQSGHGPGGGTASESSLQGPALSLSSAPPAGLQ